MSQSSKTRRDANLTYPFENTPEPGELVNIVAGVNWLRMPLPFSLNHINLWAIEGVDDWTIVDTGLASDETIELWQAVHAKYGSSKPFKNLFITHMHPDHIGLAGWLTRTYKAELSITRSEYLTCRHLLDYSHKEAPQEAIDFYRAAGLDEEQLENYQSQFGGFGKFVRGLPHSYRRLTDGQIVKMGNHSWRVIVGSGHSTEHACFYCEELNVIISGDQILPTISSNVSLRATEPYENPLQDWLDSCQKLIDELPADVLVLPSHGKPFVGAHERLNGLINEHESDMEKLKVECINPKRAIDVFPILFRAKIDRNNLLMATGESLAHLNCLVARGEMNVTMDDNGVNYYQTKSEQGA